jgi:protein-S-isoprenylcysteine O-methyltransferase Ste14
MRQNSFASRVIEIQDKQQLVDTGLYAVIRHPMYLAAITMYFFMPIVLGSYYSFVIMLIFPFLMNRRMQHEEEILEKGLEGYKEYMQRVKFRIIPYIW